jgi:hypothetical protein
VPEGVVLNMRDMADLSQAYYTERPAAFTIDFNQERKCSWGEQLTFPDLSV